MKQAHIVPLSSQAVAIFKELRAISDDSRYTSLPMRFRQVADVARMGAQRSVVQQWTVDVGGTSRTAPERQFTLLLRARECNMQHIDLGESVETTCACSAPTFGNRREAAWTKPAVYPANKQSAK